MSDAASAGEQDQAAITEALSDLALDRTAQSSQRTVMAWMRTSVSLYTFGFSITKFGDYLAQQSEGASPPTSLGRLGLILTSLGILVLVFAVGGHMHRVTTMTRLGLSAHSRSFLPIGAAVALFVIGLVTSISITWN
jgi:putative membrane protein